ncbi:hypothetical protein I4U23_005235 [Adineta vaga]|nr:hypothetical protein I4U23_005235 [Adineta vaga]
MIALKYLIMRGSCTYVYLIIFMLAEQKRETPVFRAPSILRPDSILYDNVAKKSNVLHSSTRGFFNRLNLPSLKFVSNDIETYDNNSLCSAVNISWSVKTSFEFDDTYRFPQHRLKLQRTNLTPAVCFYRDSFVPIYADHITVLQEAKQYIDNLGTHEFLAAYISPSHYGYVANKLNSKEMIGVGHRLSMINLAITNLNWVMVDLFETFQPCNTKSSVIMKAFISRLHSQLPDGRRIDVFWLTGEDLFTYNGPPDEMIRLGFQPIYIINRGSNKSIFETNNQLKSDQDYYEKQWQDIRTLSSFPERSDQMF